MQPSGTPKAQCFICGISQTIVNPSVSLTKNCLAAPTFTYTLGLTTTAVLLCMLPINYMLIIILTEQSNLEHLILSFSLQVPLLLLQMQQLL